MITWTWLLKTFLLYLLFVLLLLSAITPLCVHAGGCGTATYSYPTYASSHSSYSTGYAVKQVYVPKAVKAYVSPDVAHYAANTYPDHYASVSDYYRDKLLVDAISGQVAGKTEQLLKVQEELASLRVQMQHLTLPQQYQPQTQPQTYVQPYTQPQTHPQYVPNTPGPETLYRQYPNHSQYQQQQQQQHYPQNQYRHPAPEPPARMPDAPNGQGDTQNADPTEGGAVPPALSQVVQNSCIRCHGSGYQEQGGGFDMRDLHRMHPQDRLLSYVVVNTGEMPKGGRPLGQEEAELFLQWARNGVTVSASRR